MCGADTGCQRGRVRFGGSSPRVRSRRCAGRQGPIMDGIISACAEQTLWQRYVTRSDWDHLRVCGADSCILLWFGLVGCRGIFDSCTARGRKTTWMPIFGIDALGSRMFLCEISEPSPCAEFWLRLHCVHVRCRGGRMWCRRAPAGQPPCERLRNAAALPEIKPVAEVCVSFALRRAQ